MNLTYDVLIKKFILASCAPKIRILDDITSIQTIDLAISKIIYCIKNGHKLLVMGNGGSASDAQHFCAELVGKFLASNRRSYPCIALTANTSNITAIANDYGYDHIFSRQIESLAQDGDIVIALSTSGNSRNVYQGLLAAKKKGLISIGLSGTNPNLLKEVCDVCVTVPSNKASHIQETHIMILHIICEIIENGIH